MLVPSDNLVLAVVDGAIWILNVGVIVQAVAPENVPTKAKEGQGVAEDANVEARRVHPIPSSRIVLPAGDKADEGC